MIIHSSGTRTQVAGEWFYSGRLAEFFSNLQLWQLVTLQSFNQQTSAVSLSKDLNLFCWHITWPRDSQHLKIGFALSKWPHFQGAYVIRVLIFFATAVSPKKVWKLFEFKTKHQIKEEREKGNLNSLWNRKMVSPSSFKFEYLILKVPLVYLVCLASASSRLFPISILYENYGYLCWPSILS